MPDSIDPYHEWLGIPPKEQPPSYYQLLGIEPFESNSRVIVNALNRQKLHLQSLQATENPELCQRLLDEIQEAADCLSDPERRVQYDADLPSAEYTKVITGATTHQLGNENPRLGLSVEIFGKLVTQCGLLSSAEVAAAHRRVVEQIPVHGAEALADELVRSDSLTRYQADVILSGRNCGLVFADYVVRMPIGAGAMGEVFEAIHRTMHRRVAIKVLGNSATQSLQSLDAVKRFKREITAAARLHHRNVVTAYDAGELDGLYYLVMEFIDGIDLGRRVRLEGPLSLTDTIRAVFEAACGLNYVHEAGVVHRDIKPANLMIGPDGAIKILDLSVASLRDDSLESASATSFEHLTSHGQIVGTAHFMSPEQANDPRLSDGRSDIYGLGCTLYFLLTANLPYVGHTLPEILAAHRESPIPRMRSVRSDVPPWLDEIFARMVAKRPEERFQSMKEVMVAIRNSVGAAKNAAPVRELETRKAEALEIDGRPEINKEVRLRPTHPERPHDIAVDTPSLPHGSDSKKVSKDGTTETSAALIETTSSLIDLPDVLSSIEPMPRETGRFAFHGIARQHAKGVVRLAVLMYVVARIIENLATLLLGSHIEESFANMAETLVWLAGLVIPAVAVWFFGVPLIQQVIAFVARLVEKPWSVQIWQFKFFQTMKVVLRAWGASLVVWLAYRVIYLVNGPSAWFAAGFLAVEAAICIGLISSIIWRLRGQS